ncbi:MAG: sialidase family protein [Sphingomonas sp.]
MGVMWTEVYASDDGGDSWDFLSRVNDFGAPGSLVVKKDGRLVMVYGYRLMPSGVRAAVSEDGGRTLGPRAHHPRRRRELGCRLSDRLGARRRQDRHGLLFQQQGRSRAGQRRQAAHLLQLLLDRLTGERLVG